MNLAKIVVIHSDLNISIKSIQLVTALVKNQPIVRFTAGCLIMHITKLLLCLEYPSKDSSDK